MPGRCSDRLLLEPSVLLYLLGIARLSSSVCQLRVHAGALDALTYPPARYAKEAVPLGEEGVGIGYPTLLSKPKGKLLVR